MGKKANDKSISDASNPRSVDTGNDDLPPSEDDRDSADMSADETEMFNKIMGEIEGQGQSADPAGGGKPEENTDSSDAAQADDLDEDQQKAFESIMAQIEGGDKPKDSGENAGESEAPAAGEEDDFAAELEKVAKAAETATADDPPPETGDGDDSDDELDEDQQKALESIMAQIEGGNKPKDSGENAGESEAPAAGEEDDFAAELEKVAKAAETATADDPPPETGDGDDADGELDEDQQKALESIMAQIEGGNKPKDSGENAGESEAPAAGEEDDFVAELEKVAEAAETATADDPPPETGDDEKAPNEDQQAVPENITPEKKGDDTGKDALAADHASGTPAESSETRADGSNNQDTRDDTSDISDDIEDILKEITSDIDSPKESGAGRKTDADEPQADSGRGDIAAGPAQPDTVSEKKAPKSDPPVDKAAPQAPPVVQKTRGDAAAPEKKQDQEKVLAQPPTSPLTAIDTAGRFGGKKRLIAFVLVVCCLGVAGYFYSLRPRETPSSATVAPSAEENVQPAVVAEKTQPEPFNDDSSDQHRLKAMGEEIDQLRADLIAKRKEIEELRTYYQSGIDAEIQNIVKRLQATGHGRISLKTATADPLVSMGIEAIQRRDAYIRKLENPADALYLNSEELLYLSRKSSLLAMMAAKTSDIAVDDFLEQVRVIMAAHRNALAQLNIDGVDVPKSKAETIWQGIDAILAQREKDAIQTQTAGKTENESIWAAVCSGNFSQKHKLTELSEEAARCLAGWKGKDLFLNGLTVLTPAVARQLADWNGEWLGLNGLKELSPEAATYLARWKGKGLSLNGLTRLSPRVVAILSEWQGEQIELVNVKHMAHWENTKTRLFLSEEMDRKINAKRP